MQAAAQVIDTAGAADNVVHNQPAQNEVTHLTFGTPLHNARVTELANSMRIFIGTLKTNASLTEKNVTHESDDDNDAPELGGGGSGKKDTPPVTPRAEDGDAQAEAEVIDLDLTNTDNGGAAVGSNETAIVVANSEGTTALGPVTPETKWQATMKKIRDLANATGSAVATGANATGNALANGAKAIGHGLGAVARAAMEAAEAQKEQMRADALAKLQEPFNIGSVYNRLSNNPFTEANFEYEHATHRFNSAETSKAITDLVHAFTSQCNSREDFLENFKNFLEELGRILKAIEPKFTFMVGIGFAPVKGSARLFNQFVNYLGGIKNTLKSFINISEQRHKFSEELVDPSIVRTSCRKTDLTTAQMSQYNQLSRTYHQLTLAIEHNIPYYQKKGSEEDKKV